MNDEPVRTPHFRNRITEERRKIMNYETPELLDIGASEDVVLGSKKPSWEDMNGTGIALVSVDEDVD